MILTLTELFQAMWTAETFFKISKVQAFYIFTERKEIEKHMLITVAYLYFLYL